MGVSPLVETRFMVQRELRKSFRSIKGIILSVLTVAGGGGLALLFAQSDDIRQKRMHEKDISPEMLLEAKRKLFGWWFMDEKTGEHLGSAPGLIFFLFAVSLVLIVCAGLFVQSLRRASHIDLGFRPDGLVLASVSVGLQGYEPSKGQEFYRRLVARA